MPANRILILSMTVAATLTFLGCHTHPPLSIDELHEAGLSEFHDALNEAIHIAKSDPDQTWRHGWSATAIVRLDPHGSQGMCTQWQSLSYQAIRPLINDSPWAIYFIRNDHRGLLEHNAVILYRHDWLTPGRDLLDAEPGDPVYVVDPWPHGRADFFRLSEWLETYAQPIKRPELYDPIEEMKLRHADPPSRE